MKKGQDQREKVARSKLWTEKKRAYIGTLMEELKQSNSKSN